MRWRLTARVGWHARQEITAMIYYALVVLVIALVAGALGLAGVATMASQISWILFLVGIALLVIHLVTGRQTPTL